MKFIKFCTCLKTNVLSKRQRKFWTLRIARKRTDCFILLLVKKPYRKKIVRDIHGVLHQALEKATRLINAKKSAGVTVPAFMEIIWSWEHSKMIKKTAHVHRLLDMMKG